MNVWLTPEAKRGWEKLCEEEGVGSITALVEAVGRAMDSGAIPVDRTSWDEVFETARVEAEQRRSRKPEG